MLSILNERAVSHNTCEDSVYVTHDKQNNIISGGVFDGCSSGINSAWASRTLAYLYKNHDVPTSSYASIMSFYEMRKIKEMLSLDVNHFESTCLLFYYNTLSKTLIIRAFGDGVYFVNDIRHDIEQNNMPDYIAHCMLKDNSLSDYLHKYPYIVYENVDSFKICSDGINAIKANQFEPTTIDPMTFLLANPTSENYLKRMCNILHKKRFTLNDDLSIISYVSDKIYRSV